MLNEISQTHTIRAHIMWLHLYGIGRISQFIGTESSVEFGRRGKREMGCYCLVDSVYIENDEVWV